jgi:hypothetical protein
MAITLNELTVNFDHLERERVLEDWCWLLGQVTQPILLTAAGDAFVQDVRDGSIHLLDVAAGELLRVADGMTGFRALLADREFVLNHFAVERVVNLRDAGVILGPGEIYSFRHPPVLGGEYTLENVEPADIEVHFSLAGQIHQQVRDLPPGTVVEKISIE